MELHWELTGSQALPLIVVCLAFNGVALLLAGERVRGALRRHTHVREQLGLAQLSMTRDVHAASVVVRDGTQIKRLLNQIVLDTTGRFPGIHSVVLLGAHPSYIQAEGEGDARYVFSPYRITRSQHGQRLSRRIERYVISPVASHSFVVEQLEAIYQALTEAAADMHETPPPLPRVAVWQLLVVPAEIGIDF